MAKRASQRRFQKRAAALSELFAGDPVAFRRLWETLLANWVEEIRVREHAQRCRTSPDPIPAIFGILDNAQALAKAAKADGDQKVIADLAMLRHECAKAVARVTDRRLYRFSHDCTVRLAGVSRGSRKHA